MTPSRPLPAVVCAAHRGATDRRATRAELNLERIVAAGIAVADRDGLAGISMAKVARELGSATMSLYRHVASKDELLLHMQDTALGSPDPAATAGLPWRDALRNWTHALTDALAGHPWTLGLPVEAPPLMPRSLEWFDRSLAVLVPLPLWPFEKLSTTLLLSGYARSVAALRVSIPEHAPGEPDDSEVYAEALGSLADPARYPALAAVLAEGLFTTAPGARTDDDYLTDFGLERILDGVATLIDTRTDDPSGPPAV